MIVKGGACLITHDFAVTKRRITSDVVMSLCGDGSPWAASQFHHPLLSRWFVRGARVHTGVSCHRFLVARTGARSGHQPNATLSDMRLTNQCQLVINDSSTGLYSHWQACVINWPVSLGNAHYQCRSVQCWLTTLMIDQITAQTSPQIIYIVLIIQIIVNIDCPYNYAHDQWFESLINSQKSSHISVFVGGSRGSLKGEIRRHPSCQALFLDEKGRESFAWNDRLSHLNPLISGTDHRAKQKETWPRSNGENDSMVMVRAKYWWLELNQSSWLLVLLMVRANYWWNSGWWWLIKTVTCNNGSIVVNSGCSLMMVKHQFIDGSCWFLWLELLGRAWTGATNVSVAD